MAETRGRALEKMFCIHLEDLWNDLPPEADFFYVSDLTNVIF